MIVKVCEALPLALVAVIVTVYAPIAVGFPEIAPVGESIRPGGSAPEVMANVFGYVPLATKTWV